jgi:hypothetical protein
LVQAFVEDLVVETFRRKGRNGGRTPWKGFRKEGPEAIDLLI